VLTRPFPRRLGKRVQPFARDQFADLVGHTRDPIEHVCWMFLWPSQACSARVSWPAFASA
jgi:hypothetical protein